MLMRCRQIARESGSFCTPAAECRATASLSLGKLKSRTRLAGAEVLAYMVRGRPRRPEAQRHLRAKAIESASGRSP